MKKLVCIIAVLLCVSLVGCTKDKSTSSSAQSTSKSSEESGSSKPGDTSSNGSSSAQSKQGGSSAAPSSSKTTGGSVSSNTPSVKEPLSVTVTLPRNLIGDGFAPENDTEEYQTIQNSDGSITLKMTPTKHKSELAELKNTTVNGLNELKNDESYSFIKEVSYNSNFSAITYTVDKELCNKAYFAPITFNSGIYGAIYQIFAGTAADSAKVTVNFKDQATGEVLNTSVYPGTEE